MSNTRALKRRAYNSWWKFKKKMRKISMKDSRFTEESFTQMFESRFPNPMYHAEDYTKKMEEINRLDAMREERAANVLSLLSR